MSIICPAERNSHIIVKSLFVMSSYRNPQNNHVVMPNNFLVVLGAFLVGPIFFFCIGEIGHGFANIILGVLLWMIFLGWIVWIAYAIAAPGIVRSKWMSKGYIEQSD